jgi:hypothetical protein
VATTVAPAGPLLQHPRAQDGQHLVAVDRPSLPVAQDHPVGVAVQRDPDGGALAANLLGQSLGVQGPAAVVDVAAVGLDAQREHIRPQLGEHLRRHLIPGAVGAVDHHLDAVQGLLPGEGPLEELDVAAARVVDAGGLADLPAGAGAPVLLHQPLDLCLHVVGQLESRRRRRS